MGREDRKGLDGKILRRTLSFVTPFKSTFILTCIITILLSFMAPVRTLLIKYAIDDNIQNGDKEGLKEIIFFLLILLIVHAVMQFTQAYLANWLGQSVVLNIRRNLFKHVVSFRLKYFDNTPIGSLVTRVTSDIQTINEVFASGLLNIISDILQLSVVLVFMFFINYKLTLIVLIPVPILIISTIMFKRIIEVAFKKVRVKVAEINTFVQEHVTGMNIVQIFNREEEEMRRFKKVNKEHMNGWLKTVWANAVFFPVVEVLSAASIGLLVWWGARGVIDGFAKIGDIMAFILFIHMMYRPIRQLADRFNTLQMGIIAAERVFKILDTDEHISNEGSISDQKVNGEIEFKHVWFAYKGEDYVLKDISMRVKPGQTLALVGATGAGKSSIINVLTKFYEINKGEITIDGIDINKFTLDYLRKVTAVVLQDVFLFAGTIAENVNLKNEEITQAKLEAAADSINARDFIESLEKGWEYEVMERGSSLSVGQRQLISFIRAMAADPSVLILDEATSSVDSETEELIQAATKKLMKGRTSIVIAHRLSTVKEADTILVLDKGRVIEQGTHEELLAKEGAYNELFQKQFELA